ncbi:MAG: hypothetical protein EpisKO_06450 [Epibacterium sp.]
MTPSVDAVKYDWRDPPVKVRIFKDQTLDSSFRFGDYTHDRIKVKRIKVLQVNRWGENFV